MIAKRSDLILKRFAIVDSHLSFNITTESETQNTLDILNSYPVDIDFSIEKDTSKVLYRIVVSVDINNEKEKQGYGIGVTGIGFFEFDESTNLQEDDKIQMLQISGLSICISNLRSYIANQTSYFPWGSFSFHAVDVQDLLISKNQLTNSN